MAGIFDAGQASQTTTPGALAPADIASRLFAIKLLLARLGQGGGAPQTFGEYIKSGPRKLPGGVTGAASNDLMSALSQPGAFTKGPTSTKYKPSSPSLFQDAAGALPLLLMLNQLGKGSGSQGLSIQDQLLAKALGVDPSTLKQPQESPGLFSRIGSGLGDLWSGSGASPGMGDTSSTSFDPSMFESQDLGMSIDPNASTDLLSSLFSSNSGY